MLTLENTNLLPFLEYSDVDSLTSKSINEGKVSDNSVTLLTSLLMLLSNEMLIDISEYTSALLSSTTSAGTLPLYTNEPTFISSLKLTAARDAALLGEGAAYCDKSSTKSNDSALAFFTVTELILVVVGLTASPFLKNLYVPSTSSLTSPFSSRSSTSLNLIVVVELVGILNSPPPIPTVRSISSKS